MRLLLDTHIWLWALRQPDKLSLAVRRQIANRKNQLYLSPISIWEAQIVVRSKKLRIATSFSKWLEESLIQLPVQQAMLNFAVAPKRDRSRSPSRISAMSSSQRRLALTTSRS